MKLKNPFVDLTRFELSLWILSSVVVIATSFLSGSGLLNAAASFIGVTALIFVAKGYVIGEVLTVVFAVFYGVISFQLQYYGEVITYMFMTAPIAAITIIEWLKHPFKDTKEVKVSKMTSGKIFALVISSILVTVLFYYLLKFLGNANLLFSTISVTTSFVASYLTYCRSPYYAIGYALNDIVLIVLWILASINNINAIMPAIYTNHKRYGITNHSQNGIISSKYTCMFV